MNVAWQVLILLQPKSFRVPVSSLYILLCVLHVLHVKYPVTDLISLKLGKHTRRHVYTHDTYTHRNAIASKILGHS